LMGLTAFVLIGFLYVLYRAIQHESDMFLLVLTTIVAVSSMIAASGWSHPYVVADNGTTVSLLEEAIYMSPLMSGISMISIMLAVYVAVDYAYRLYTSGGD